MPYEVGVSRYRELARGQICGDSYGMLKLLVSPSGPQGPRRPPVRDGGNRDRAHRPGGHGLRRDGRLLDGCRFQLPDPGRGLQSGGARRHQQAAGRRAPASLRPTSRKAGSLRLRHSSSATQAGSLSLGQSAQAGTLIFIETRRTRPSHAASPRANAGASTAPGPPPNTRQRWGGSPSTPKPSVSVSKALATCHSRLTAAVTCPPRKDRGPTRVGEGGLEPPRPCGHRNLNPARLPNSATRPSGLLRVHERSFQLAPRGKIGARAPGPRAVLSNVAWALAAGRSPG